MCDLDLSPYLVSLCLHTFSQAVIIKMGKKTEQLSINKKEFSNWWTILQQTYCIGESLEFNEEEDDIIRKSPLSDDYIVR